MGELQVKVEIPGILEFFNFQNILFNSDPQGYPKLVLTFWDVELMIRKKSIGKKLIFNHLKIFTQISKKSTQNHENHLKSTIFGVFWHVIWQIASIFSKKF